jgi:hypothetical protein
MRSLSFVIGFLLSASVTQEAIASDTPTAQLQQFIEQRILCERAGVGEDGINLIKKITKPAGFEILAISELDEGPIFLDYSGLLVRKTGNIKIFDFDVLAVNFELDTHKFAVLLNAKADDIIKMIKSRDDKAQQIDLESRVLFANPNTMGIGVYIPAGSPFAIEVGSCNETTNKYALMACKRFTKLPSVWVGCTYAQDEVMRAYRR